MVYPDGSPENSSEWLEQEAKKARGKYLGEKSSPVKSDKVKVTKFNIKNNRSNSKITKFISKAYDSKVVSKSVIKPNKIVLRLSSFDRRFG